MFHDVVFVKPRMPPRFRLGLFFSFFGHLFSFDDTFLVSVCYKVESFGQR